MSALPVDLFDDLASDEPMVPAIRLIVLADPDEHVDPTTEVVVEDEVRRRVMEWTPTSRRGAEWAGRMWTHHTGETDKIKASFDEQIALIQAARADALRPHTGRVEFFDGALQRYAIAEREAAMAVDAKSAPGTTHLGSVSITTTYASAPSLDIADDEAFIPWAKAHQPAAVKVEESALKSKLDYEVEYVSTRQILAERFPDDEWDNDENELPEGAPTTWPVAIAVVPNEAGEPERVRVPGVELAPPIVKAQKVKARKL